MNWNNNWFLLPHEREALKNALLRDILNELEKATTHPEYAQGHGLNARMSQRILEAFFTNTEIDQMTSENRAT